MSDSFRNLSSSSSASFLKPAKESGGVSAFKGIASHLRKRKRRDRGGPTTGTPLRGADISTSSLLCPLQEGVGLSEQDLDNVSVSSLDFLPEEQAPPEIKRSKKSMSRVTSLASVLSTPMQRVGNAFTRSFSGAKLPPPSPSAHQMQPSNLLSSPSPSVASLQHCSTPTRESTSFLSRSFSTAGLSSSVSSASLLMRAPESPYGTLKRGGSGRGSTAQLTPYKAPVPTPNKQRPTRYWSTMFESSTAVLRKQELKHQEAIYEISCGEEDLAEDLQLVQKTYADSLLSLKILTPAEVQLVFGKLKELPPLHIELYRALRALRCPKTGVSKNIGKIMLPWVNKLRGPYIEYCAQLIRIKVFLDNRREADKDFCDFLQRCLESPFSRKLDLWSYLDVPRSRFVKYPLLLKQVLKFSECQADCSMLGAAIRNLEDTLMEVDRAMARARCDNTLGRLDWLDDSPDKRQTVKDATEEMLEGVLRNSRGTKLECHLMNTVFIMGRPSSRGLGGVKRLQVYRKPIPVRDLIVEDLDSGTGKQGSFKSAFSSSQPVKNAFKIGFRAGQNQLDPSDGEHGSRNRSQHMSGHQMTHTLIAPDEHSKRQWLTTLQKTIDGYFVASAKQKIAEVSLMRTISGDDIGDLSQLKGLRQQTPRKFNRSRQALFQNKRSSPRIKASLSHAALETLKRSGSISVIQQPGSNNQVASVRRGLRRSNNVSQQLLFSNDENATPMSHKGRAVPKIIVPSSARKSKSAACLRNPNNAGGAIANAKRGGALLKVTAEQERRPPLAPRHNNSAAKKVTSSASVVAVKPALRGRTKSWSQLATSTPKGGPRYMTRSKAKISKSMSSLLHL